MPLLDINRDPSPTTLRWFGLIQAAGVGLIGLVAYWRFQLPAIAYALWSFAAVFAAVYYAIPTSRRWLYLAVTFATYPLGVVLAYVALFVIYFGLFTTVGLLMRVFGYDPLRRKFDRGARSYWSPRASNRPVSSYFRQF